MGFRYVLVGMVALGVIMALVMVGIETGILCRRTHMVRATVIKKMRYPSRIEQVFIGHVIIGTTSTYPVRMPARHMLTLSFAETHDHITVNEDIYDRCEEGASIWITCRDRLFGRKSCESVVCAPRG